jgi:HAD superfamily hydrolase (TIGR01484 family)
MLFFRKKTWDFMENKGWLALDIDGTLTERAYEIPPNIISYLKKRYFEGWNLIILTGRSLPFALSTVANIDFPFILSTQNGATAWQMPKKEMIFELFFEKDAFKKIDEEVNKQLALIIYGDDGKIYCKKNGKYEDYFNNLSTLSNQLKMVFEDFEKDLLPLRAPLIKIVGREKEVVKAGLDLEKKELGEAPIIKDPFHKDFHLLLLTKKGVSKGLCIKKIVSLYGGGRVIAAGNDNNDLSMFNHADIKIAIKGSPEALLAKADIIAPPCETFGIIEGIDRAMERIVSYTGRV